MTLILGANFSSKQDETIDILRPSHGRGEPEVPEPLTLGAQYITRYNTWNKFVRATRPALLCASPETNIRVKCSP